MSITNYEVSCFLSQSEVMLHSDRQVRLSISLSVSQSIIHSDDGLKLETSALETLYFINLSPVGTKSVCQKISIHRSVSQLISLPVRQRETVGPSVGQKVLQPVSQLVDQSFSQSVSQSVRYSHPTVSQLIRFICFNVLPTHLYSINDGLHTV